jgi:hypothetical protein
MADSGNRSRRAPRLETPEERERRLAARRIRNREAYARGAIGRNTVRALTQLNIRAYRNMQEEEPLSAPTPVPSASVAASQGTHYIPIPSPNVFLGRPAGTIYENPPPYRPAAAAPTHQFMNVNALPNNQRAIVNSVFPRNPANKRTRRRSRKTRKRAHRK